MQRRFPLWAALALAFGVTAFASAVMACPQSASISKPATTAEGDGAAPTPDQSPPGGG
jgi:hypothetical protein